MILLRLSSICLSFLIGFSFFKFFIFCLCTSSPSLIDCQIFQRKKIFSSVMDTPWGCNYKQRSSIFTTPSWRPLFIIKLEWADEWPKGILQNRTKGRTRIWARKRKGFLVENCHVSLLTRYMTLVLIVRIGLCWKASSTKEKEDPLHYPNKKKERIE